MNTVMFILGMLSLTTLMFAAAISFAKEDADGRVYEREVTVSKINIGNEGQRFVVLEARQVTHLPLCFPRTIEVQVQDILAYDTVRKYGAKVYLAKYIKTRKWFTVTDEYLELQEVNGRYIH